MQYNFVYNKAMERTILHCDLNNFYASVEQLHHPEYDGLPLAVSGNPKMRHGIILAKNQIAKQCGVQTGEPIWQALRKCPNMVLVPPRFEDYVAYSKQVFEIYTGYTDRVESFGIDECWLDVTGCRHLFGSGEEIADKLREEVKRKTGLTISVGVSFTKILAKLGSDLKKPDATTVLTRENYMEKVGSLPPSELIMIGKKTANKLRDLNIKSIRDLANADYNLLEAKFGKIGGAMINAAAGLDKEEVKLYYDNRVPKSVSNGTTTPRNIENPKEAKVVVYALCELIAMRMRKFSVAANGVAVSIKTPDLQTVTKQAPLPYPTSNAADIAVKAMEILLALHSFDRPLRAVTVAAIRLEDKYTSQLSLFDDGEKEDNLEKSIDAIREKYGYNSVKRGVLLNNDLAVNLHDEDGFVPFKR